MSGAAGTGKGSRQDDAVDRLAESTRAEFDRWRAGDDHAGARLFMLHQSWLLARIHRRLGAKLRAKEEAEDLAQRVALKLLSYEPKEEDGAVDRFRGLLNQMAENVINDEARHFEAARRNEGSPVPITTDSRLEPDLPSQEVATPSKVFERVESVTLARVTLWFIEPEKRDLIALRWWYHVPFSDLTRRFGGEEATLRMRHQRAQQELARVMAKVKPALGKLPADELELLQEQARLQVTVSSRYESGFVVGSSIERFVAFLDALRHVAALTGETLRKLPDGWPRVLLAQPRDGAT